MSHWGKMMNDELAAISGKHEELVGKLQEKYGVAKEEAKRQVTEFKKVVEQLKMSNTKLTEMQKALNKQLRAGRNSVKSRTTVKVKNRSKTSR